ncbi:MAG: hypothetical protein KDA27_03510 [Candidatus Eisenbacteria bacterium]|uniref:Rad50/SbcC-type AAA domain-containing protein n=1 Tax=Eiseniibacteriota bacterium TaxID=2212470 RepID=A0A956NDG0_UNCEI|nr:hypothetical protein [Candidatus Eisenbacteria bacterium]
MLRIRELTLAGFGVYEHPTRFLIPEGPAVFWGANETGKSTFLWGVAAVWFGLPQNSDPSKIGTARFRSFSRPEEFWGELVWERDDKVYRLRRDFDRHKVCLTEESTDGGVKELFHGEHNPSGRSSAGTVFPMRLKETIGVGTLETFLQTFCLTQPFVGEAQIESELQHLISGSRFVKTDDVLSHLFGEIKTLTKNTGELGLVRPGNSRPTNQREDGKLEALQTELARARLDLELGRKHLERIHSEGEGVREIEEEAAELRAQIEERTRRLDALSRWTELQNERTKRTETVRRLEGSVAELDALARDRDELSGRDDALSKIYETAPEDAAERLEALERADRDQAAAAAKEDAHQQKRKALDERISELEGRLSNEFSDFRGRRDWIDVRNRLREAVARADRAETALKKLQGEVLRRERDLEATSSLDNVSVATAQSHADGILEAYDRVTKIETKLTGLRKQTAEREYLEDQGRMALLQESLDLETERKESETGVREKRAAVVLAKDLLDQAEERLQGRTADGSSPDDASGSTREAGTDSEPGAAGSAGGPSAATKSARSAGSGDFDVHALGGSESDADVDPHSSSANNDLGDDFDDHDDHDDSENLEDEPAFESASAQTPSGPPAPPGAIPALSLALGAAVAMVLLYGLGWAIQNAVGLGLAVAGVAFLVLARFGGVSTSKSRKAKASGSKASGSKASGSKKTESKGTARKTGTHGTQRKSSGPESGALADEAIAPGARLRRHLEETRSELVNAPTEEELDAPRQLRIALEEAETQLALALKRQADLEARLAELREELGEFADTTANELARMDERWKLLDEQIEALEEERAEILEDRLGTSDDDDWLTTPVSETNEILESLLLLPGGPSPEDNPSLDDLLSWLTRLDDVDWEAFQDAETARSDAQRELREARVRLEQAGTLPNDREEIEELSERFRPFTLETDPKWLLAQQEECEELERQLAKAQTQLEAMGPEKTATKDRDVATELWNALTIDWPALGGPELDRALDEPLHEWAARARKELRTFRDLSVRTSTLDESSPRILRSAGVSSREELESRLAEERSALGQAVRELESLEKSEIALADSNAVTQSSRAETLGARRTAELASLERDREALDRVDLALREKLRERGTLEGKEIPNLAALELETEQLEEEVEQTQLRCDALALAFRWAEEATGEFRSTYQESLGERIDHHFSRLTRTTGRRIELGDTFAIRVRDANGRILEPEQLSQGARDQLLLAIRLGVADLLSDAVPLPFLFDDPFVHFDDARLAQLRVSLESMSPDRQWILLTHRKEMNAWADPIFTDTLEDVGAPVGVEVGAPAHSFENVSAEVPATIRLVDVSPDAAEGQSEPSPERPQGRQGRRRKRRRGGKDGGEKPGGGGKLFDIWGRS